MVDAIVGDVIQLDPTRSVGELWGPLLCVVDELKSWGVKCYHFHPGERGQPPAAMYLRVDHGCYAVIGRAQWKHALDNSEDLQDE